VSSLAIKSYLRVALAFGLVSFVTGLTAAQDIPGPHQSVLPDVPTAIILSNRDTNRIVCVSGDIEGYRFSEEKGAVVDSSGSEAFIKFLIEKFGEEQKYVQVRSEFYFQCGGVTYTLLAAPQDVPAMAVYLVPGTGQNQSANRVLFSPLSEEERAVTITLGMLKDDIPASFSVRDTNDRYNQHVLPRLDVRLHREVSAVGTAYSAREYRLRARSSIELLERAFLHPFFGAAIYAVTFERTSLEAGEVGRVIIVYRGVQS